MVPISLAVGRKRALEMLLTGELVSAETALEWGLVNRVVPAEMLQDAVDDLALSIANASALTIAIGKQAFYAQIDLDERQAYDITVPVMTMNAMTDDADEGISAFLEKRAPIWRNSRRGRRCSRHRSRTATALLRRGTTRRRPARTAGRRAGRRRCRASAS